MKNAGKACNNRLYRHIRTFEKIVKNYFVIYYKKIIFLNLKSILKVMDMIQEVLENGFYDLRRDPETS